MDKFPFKLRLLKISLCSSPNEASSVFWVGQVSLFGTIRYRQVT